jgi:hypothetical protein
MNKKIYSKFNEAKYAEKASSEICRVVMVSVVFIDQISQLNSTRQLDSTQPQSIQSIKNATVASKPE